MKKMYKILLILVMVFGLFAISTSYVSAEEIIPEDETEIPNISENEEEIPLEPSELAKWIEENIIQVVASIITALSGIITLLVILFKNAKKLANALKKERDDVNLEIKDIIKELSETKEMYNDLLVAFKGLLDNVEESVTEANKANMTFNELKAEIVTTKEMLRVGLSNNKELVRLGIAEEINKIAKKGV